MRCLSVFRKTPWRSEGMPHVVHFVGDWEGYWVLGIGSRKQVRKRAGKLALALMELLAFQTTYDSYILLLYAFILNLYSFSMTIFLIELICDLSLNRMQQERPSVRKTFRRALASQPKPFGDATLDHLLKRATWLLANAGLGKISHV